MAKKAALTTFSNPDGYRFVDNGITTAVLDGNGTFTLKEAGGASVEVFRTWRDFILRMEEKPTTGDEDDILDQLSSMGLGECQPITDLIGDHAVAVDQTPKEEKPQVTGEEQMAKKKAAAKAKKSGPAKERKVKELHPCPCGCGAEVVGTFKMGHDARVHGWQKKIERGDMKMSELNEVARKWMRDNGVVQGTAQPKPAKAKAKAKAKSKPKAEATTAA